ncbi:DEAD/DEAH box helicase [Candidatus Bathyarchaeota archaeon]|nr:DEAD/DEAH box helicase [Candidatus Bathyarchaeota archaeon]
MVSSDVFGLVGGEIVRAFELEKPTEVQKATIREVLDGKECLVVAETGSGKTEAVMLPLLKLIHKKPVACLYVTPLRALNRDIFTRMRHACERLGYRIETRHGDTSPRIRQEQLKDPPDLLVTTPETFQALLVAPKFREHLRNVEFVIIDEIHELMDNKRGPQLACAVARLRRVAKFKLYGLSATVSEPDKVAKYFWNGNVTTVVSDEEKVKEIVVEVPNTKDEDLQVSRDSGLPIFTVAKLRRVNELSAGQSTIIFTNTRSIAEILTSRLKKVIDVKVHHGSLSREHRESVEKRFKEGTIDKVISTSSLELGIDIGHVERVVQYGSPRRVDAFTQRVGRSGHFISRKSRGFIICDVAEAAESAVIAKRVVGGKLEPIEFLDCPFDVLAHQLTGLALEISDVNIYQAFYFFKSVWAFRELTAKDFADALRLAEQLGHIRREGNTYRRRARAWRYYYNNISTIPSEHKYKLIDSATRKPVATLDAEFVEELQTGERFVVAGTSWSVVSREGNLLFAASTGETDAVATWSGEVIPVDFHVAQEIPKAINSPEEYPYSTGTVNRIEELGKYSGHTRIEKHGDLSVIITWAGNKVNNTLAHVLGSFLTAQFGENIGIRSDEFGIVLKGATGGINLKEVIESIDGKQIERSLRITAENSQRFRKTFVHVGKRFGIIERQGLRNISPKKFVGLWLGSIVDKEAFKEYLFKKMDIQRTIAFLKKLEIEEGELSGIGKYMVEKFYPDVFEAARPKKQILDALRVRLEGTKLPLACMYCKTHLGSFTVSSAPDICPNCGSKFLGVLHSLRALRGKDLSVEEKRDVRSARLSGNLFLSHGRLALLVQAGRGVGPRTAARIIRSCENEAEMLEKLYEAEKTYARTKPFWD